MKTTILLFALILACIVPTYSQINRKSKANTPYPNLPFYQNKHDDNLGTYRFFHRLSRPLNDEVWNSDNIPTIGTLPGKDTNKTASAYNMPCLKPEGTFSMRIYKPDPTMVYSILLKKF